MLIKIIIAAALFSFYFIEMGRFPKKWNINVRPFNCLVCLPAWVSLGLYFLPLIVTEVMIAMFGAAILSVLIKTLMNKAYETGTH